MSPGSFLLWGAQCGCFHTKDRPRGPYCEPHASTYLCHGCSFQSPDTKVSGQRLELFWISPGLYNCVLPFLAGVRSLTLRKHLVNDASVRELAHICRHGSPL